MDEDRGRIRQKHQEEKRLEVEERKRLIQEADQVCHQCLDHFDNDTYRMMQERKEAILRKNSERNSKANHGRTPQRNTSAFIFGSSTPRTLNQELPSLESIGSGSSRNTNPPSLNSVPPVQYRIRQHQNVPANINSPSEETQFVRRPRPMSAYACLTAVDQRICE